MLKCAVNTGKIGCSGLACNEEECARWCQMVSDCLGIFHFYSGQEFVIMGVSEEI